MSAAFVMLMATGFLCLKKMNGLDISECGLEAYPDFVTKH